MITKFDIQDEDLRKRRVKQAFILFDYLHERVTRTEEFSMRHEYLSFPLKCAQ